MTIKMDENKLLLATIEDKYRRFNRYYSVVATDFMNLNQQSAAKGYIKDHSAAKCFLYGGFTQAERRQLVFVPDYIEAESEEELVEYFLANPAECPQVVLDISYKTGGKTLGHRDFLGSLLAEGIKREKVGDIIVRHEGAQIIVAAELGEYLSRSYSKAGNTWLDVKILPISGVNCINSVSKTVKFIVASARLDNVVAAVFSVSRKSAVDAIERGLVFVNDIEMSKPDYSLKGGEKVVLRGKGKAIYKEIEGKSKKGRLYLSFEVFTD